MMATWSRGTSDGLKVVLRSIADEPSAGLLGLGDGGIGRRHSSTSFTYDVGRLATISSTVDVTIMSTHHWVAMTGKRGPTRKAAEGCISGQTSVLNCTRSDLQSRDRCHREFLDF
jgi:hypothetical protein